MKKIFPLILMATLLLSCGKENSVVEDTNYHLSCKIDGVPTTFNVDAAAGEDNDIEIWAFALGGRNADSVNSKIFGIVINSLEDNVRVPAGTYTDNESRFEVMSGFFDPATYVEYGAGQEVYNDAINNAVTIQNHFIVQITELNEKVARGTFSGDYYEDYISTGNIKRVTEGEFYLKMQK
ncbi:hypothetical protein [Flavihumibacter fluvii]|uniref:hypothetical protein n=1 Tax=Flavihumibacter fluvii TaxID=2838157 RepID=UPI001BDF30C7|nr:hypothetical protein [Flavihumibacter fluvii]ULQ54162.1 hypothetical protein KJS93_07500 [Flavihumibacter fluvii]